MFITLTGSHRPNYPPIEDSIIPLSINIAQQEKHTDPVRYVATENCQLKYRKLCSRNPVKEILQLFIYFNQGAVRQEIQNANEGYQD